MKMKVKGRRKKQRKKRKRNQGVGHPDGLVVLLMLQNLLPNLRLDGFMILREKMVGLRPVKLNSILKISILDSMVLAVVKHGFTLDHLRTRKKRQRKMHLLKIDIFFSMPKIFIPMNAMNTPPFWKKIAQSLFGEVLGRLL